MSAPPAGQPLLPDPCCLIGTAGSTKAGAAFFGQPCSLAQASICNEGRVKSPGAKVKNEAAHRYAARPLPRVSILCSSRNQPKTRARGRFLVLALGRQFESAMVPFLFQVPVPSLLQISVAAI